MRHFHLTLLQVAGSLPILNLFLIFCRARHAQVIHLAVLVTSRGGSCSVDAGTTSSWGPRTYSHHQLWPPGSNMRMKPIYFRDWTGEKGGARVLDGTSPELSVWGSGCVSLPLPLFGGFSVICNKTCPFENGYAYSVIGIPQCNHHRLDGYLFTHFQQMCMEMVWRN